MKIIKYLLTVFLLFALFPVFSQVVEKGDFEIGTGLGLGIFQATNNDSGATSIAASGIIPVHIQYSPIEKIGLGLNFQRNGFLTEKDSGNSVQSYLLGFSLMYRAINGEKTVLFFQAAAGKSWIHYSDASIQNYVNGSGYWVDLSAGMRFYFTEHLGMFTEIAYNKQHFTNFEDKNNTLYTVTHSGQTENFWLTLAGMNLRLGLNIKF